MKVAYFTGLKQLAIREESPPAIRRRDEVLVRINRLGVCGSDVHYYGKGRIGDQRLEYPATLGHECAGTVSQVGADVRHLAPGDRVAIDPAMVCRQCDQCLVGRVNTCRKLRFMGCPGEAPGAAAEFHVLPSENCFPIPDAMTLDEAVLTEPLSIGLHAVRLADLSPVARIGVLGAGPIGLSVLLCAKATALPVAYVTDLLEPRLAVARRCGADWTGNVGQVDAAAEIARHEPMGLDTVFECSGDPACLEQAMRLLAPGGTLVFVGIPPTDEVDLPTHLMRRKELVLKNVRRQRDCVDAVIELMQEGRIDARPLLTHHFPLARIQEAFDLVSNYGDGVIKAIVDLGEDGAPA